MPIRRFYGSECMFILITYDVCTENAAGKKRLRRVAKLCVNYGVRVQNSVFECQADAAQWRALKEKLLREIDAEKDAIQEFLSENKGKIKQNFIREHRQALRRGMYRHRA